MSYESLMDDCFNLAAPDFLDCIFARAYYADRIGNVANLLAITMRNQGKIVPHGILALGRYPVSWGKQRIKPRELLKRSCPKCNAAPGKPCITKSGKRNAMSHAARIEFAVTMP